MTVSSDTTNALVGRFPAFESVDYRRLFVSNGFSAASGWMLILARGWLVFELTGSTTVAGIVTFAGFIPFAIVGPLGGALADRLDRRRLAIASTAATAGVQLVLAALTLSGTVEVWHVVALALIWLLPVIGLTVYGASRLDPGRVAIFLMLEIVIGLASAAWLLDEPFGVRETIGALLIGGAMLAEVFRQDSPTVSK